MCKLSLNGSDWEIKDFVGEDWVWRDAEKRNTKDTRWWRKATVPGSITQDLWDNEEIPDPYFEQNSLLIEWIPQRTWVYRKKFKVPDSMRGQKITLHFNGVDYAGEFYVNDQLLGHHEGMFTHFCFDITKWIDWENENQISIVLNKAPDEQPQVSKTSYVKTHKCRMTYWWDFCPRMIHLGIWDDVYLEAHGNATIENVYVRTKINDYEKSAHVILQTTVAAEEQCNATLKISISHESNIIYSTMIKAELYKGNQILPVKTIIKEPKLWWPNGYGTQSLYYINTELIVDGMNEILHSRSDVFGIRSLTFLPNEEAEIEADRYTLNVNGQKIYIKGWNWVPIDVLYGVEREKKLRHLLTLAKQAHVNMLRVWGGGLIEREIFYDLCDQYGILIWQEFIQSSSGIENKPSEEIAFIEMMKKEAQEIIPCKRNHPALAIWCGGNELQSENQVPIKDSEPVIQVLRKVVEELDEGRKFLSSSPSGRVFSNSLEFIESDPYGLHDVHGPWEHQGLTGQYTLYNKGTSLLSSEYGVEGMTNYNTLIKSIHEKSLWPPDRDNIVYFHRGAWWNNYNFVQSCFGWNINDIQTMIHASQLLQYEGLKYAVESNRRRAFHNSGSLIWQFNEPYPNSYCTSSIDYYGQPKAAYYGVQKAYAPNCVSAAFPSQALAGYENFEAEIFVHNSNVAEKITVMCEVAGSSGAIYKTNIFDTLAAGESVKAGTISIALDGIPESFFILILKGIREGKIFAENRYLFTKEKDLCTILMLEKAKLAVKIKYEAKNENQKRWLLTIINKSNHLATGVKVSLDNEMGTDVYAYFSDNFFYLLPGEEKELGVSIEGTKKNPHILNISGLGVEDSNVVLTTTI